MKRQRDIRNDLAHLPEHVDATNARTIKWKLRFGRYWTTTIKPVPGRWVHHSVILGPEQSRLFYHVPKHFIEQGSNSDLVDHCELLSAIILNPTTKF